MGITTLDVLERDEDGAGGDDEYSDLLGDVMVPGNDLAINNEPEGGGSGGSGGNGGSGGGAVGATVLLLLLLLRRWVLVQTVWTGHRIKTKCPICPMNPPAAKEKHNEN